MRRRPGIPVACLTAILLLSGCGVRHHTEAAPQTLDLNAAPERRIAELPGITPSLAARIVAGRPYGEPGDLVTRGILTERELRRIEDRITVGRGAR